MTDAKATNPKDAIGSKKAHLELVPDSAMTYMSLAFLEGALKYGRFNWRIAGVSASVYRAAGERHRAKWWNGEWADPKTRVPHLASAMACDAIILDAYLNDVLTDDRPPACAMSKLIDDAEELVAHLTEMFKDFAPYQFTIADTKRSGPMTWREAMGVEGESVIVSEDGTMKDVTAEVLDAPFNDIAVPYDTRSVRIPLTTAELVMAPRVGETDESFKRRVDNALQGLDQ